MKPDDEDPEAFFWIGPEGEIAPHPGLDAPDALRAEATIRLCNLNRGGLCEGRFEVANRVGRWLERTAALIEALDERVRVEWDEISDPRHVHKIVVRHVLKRANAPGLAEADRRLFRRGR